MKKFIFFLNSGFLAYRNAVMAINI